MPELNTSLTFQLDNEMDILLAHKRAVRFAEIAGLSVSAQTRFATAISEICRNCFEYAATGSISFFIKEIEGLNYIICQIEDKGPGIENLDFYLDNKMPIPSINCRGLGINNSKKLVNYFEIETSKKGTRVQIGQRINKPKASFPLIYNQWEKKLEELAQYSPYEELKKRNSELLLLSEEVQVKNKEIEEQYDSISRLNEKLEATNSNLREFAFAISHDLKTPLTNLNLWINLALDAEQVSKKNEYLKKSQQASKRLQETIEGLIAVIDSQNLQNETVNQFSTTNLINDILEDHSGIIKSNNAKINLIPEADTISYVHPYFKSIVTNLLTNSLKYRSSADPEIKIHTFRTDEFFVIVMSDNGIGIDLSIDYEKVFKPFARIKNKIEGRGIGLHIIKNMIEKNDGRIDVDSQPGVGTTFTCFLREY